MNKKYLIFLFLIILGIGLFASHYDTVNATLLPNQWHADVGLTEYDTPEGENWFTKAIQNGVFYILISVGKGLLFLSQNLLDYVMSDNFINTGFIDNEIVKEGLKITKNLGNIIIVLASVIIALATILRIKEYQAQKTIPILIFVALLINFAPMICGVIIDGSNITMNYFRDAGELSPSLQQGIDSGMNDMMKGTLTGQQRFGQGIALTVFALFTSIIFLLYATLFAFRYIALWLLIIFSPLAFACYILKFTRKFFTQWWNQFLQWSIIGIPAMFILFLTNIMLTAIKKQTLTSVAPQAGLTGFTVIFQYFMPVIFLIGGFFMTLQTGAAGANIVTGFFDKQVKAGSQKAGAFAQKAAGVAATTAGVAAVGAARGAKEGKGILGKIKGVGKGIFTREGQESGRETVGKAFERMHVVRPGFYEEGKRKRLKLAEEEKRMKDLSPKELLRIAEMRTITQADEVSKATAVKLLGDSGDFAFKGTPKEVKKKEQKAINLANRIGVNLSGLGKSSPELTPEINSEKFQEQLQAEIENYQKKNKGVITPTIRKEREKIVRRNMIREQVEKIKTKTFREKITPESLKHIDVFLALSPQKIKDIGERGSQKQRITIKEHLAKGSQTGKELIKIREEALKNKNKQEVQRIDEIVSAIKGSPNY